MEQKQQPTAQPSRPRLTRQQWLARRRRRRLRLIRNWILFLSLCGLAVGLMTGLILWVLPRVSRLLAGRQEFTAPSYDLSGYVFDGSDPYLVLVNNNLPLEQAQEPALAAADDATGQQLETAAAAAYRQMAQAAGEVGIHLVLVEGYQDQQRRQEQFDARKQAYLDQGMTEEEAQARASAIVPQPGCNESGTGLAADILSEEYDSLDTGFENTDAFQWLRAYAADYGFILRWPQDCQAATGMVYQPWHWRYVGVENARAIAASGLSLEEFLAVNQLS